MRLRLLPLLVIAAGLALTVRLGDVWQGFGSLARAQGVTAPADPTQAKPASGQGAGESAGGQAQSGAAPNMPAGGGEPDGLLSMSDQEVDLLQALAERRRELDYRASQIEQREALLQAAERRIEEKVDDLKALHQSIQELLRQHEEQTETQYDSLVKIYENMKPKDAARIFEQLDMAVLLPVVERMKERKTAPILAQMDPEKAQAVTVELANRRKLTEAVP